MYTCVCVCARASICVCVCVCVYVCVSQSLLCAPETNIVNQLYFNKK